MRVLVQLVGLSAFYAATTLIALFWSTTRAVVFVVSFSPTQLYSTCRRRRRRRRRADNSDIDSLMEPYCCISSPSSALAMSLKPAAIPLMDSGKALARSGELLIDLTKTMDCYGGGLSSAGAELRNAGDSIAQAAASARFKTGIELVIDELRESGNCIITASQKLIRAVEEARQEKLDELAGRLGMISLLFSWAFVYSRAISMEATHLSVRSSLSIFVN